MRAAGSVILETDLLRGAEIGDRRILDAANVACFVCQVEAVSTFDQLINPT